jgi:AcrR family transcriptional regulator
MARWQPDARGRLAQAAVELYAERGYDATAVAQIAERAGLTERTFFRHYADKREVLFTGASELQDRLVCRVRDAPPTTAPLDAVASAFEATGPFFEQLGPYVRVRQQLIDANPELHERELTKLSALAAALGDALRARGVHDDAADLTAETGVAMFKVAFGRWIHADDYTTLTQTLRESFDELRRLTAHNEPRPADQLPPPA